MTHRPGKSCRKTGTKGQPDGSAIKSKTGKPWVAKSDRKTCYATGQNNSNPTPYAASVADDEWELLHVISSHYCFIQVPYPDRMLRRFALLFTTVCFVTSLCCSQRIASSLHSAGRHGLLRRFALPVATDCFVASLCRSPRIASSLRSAGRHGLLRRFAPRNDGNTMWR